MQANIEVVRARLKEIVSPGLVSRLRKPVPGYKCVQAAISWTCALILFGIVDRIEGPYAVVEWSVDGALRFQDLPLREAPRGVSEGEGLVLVLDAPCDGPEGFQQFLRDDEACGGRVSLRIAPTSKKEKKHE